MVQIAACVCVPSVHESRRNRIRFKLYEQLLKVFLFIAFSHEIKTTREEPHMEAKMSCAETPHG